MKISQSILITQYDWSSAERTCRNLPFGFTCFSNTVLRKSKKSPSVGLVFRCQAQSMVSLGESKISDESSFKHLLIPPLLCSLWSKRKIGDPCERKPGGGLGHSDLSVSELPHRGYNQTDAWTPSTMTKPLHKGRTGQVLAYTIKFWGFFLQWITVSTWVSGYRTWYAIVAVEQLLPKELISGNGQPPPTGQTSSQHGVMGQTQKDLQHQAIWQHWEALHPNILWTAHHRNFGVMLCENNFDQFAHMFHNVSLSLQLYF